MCKTWKINYVCDHAFQILLSTCRGTFRSRSRSSFSVGKEPKVACYCGPYLTFKSTNKCGSCLRNEADSELQAEIKKIRDGFVDAVELAAAEERYSRESFLLSRRLPDQRFKRLTCVERAWYRTRVSGSLLRREVRPEDVVEKWRPGNMAVGNGWDDGGERWKTMVEEIAERKAEEVEVGEDYGSGDEERVQQGEEIVVDLDVGLVSEEAITAVRHLHRDAEVSKPDITIAGPLRSASTLSSTFHAEKVLPDTQSDVVASTEHLRTTTKRHGMFRGNKKAEASWKERSACLQSWITVSS